MKKWELLARKAPETVVGYQLRFHPDYYSMFGATGLVFARFWYGNNIINWRPDYRESYISKSHAEGGGIVAEVSHELDICQAIFGMPVKVDCVGRSCDGMAEEIEAVATLEYEEGTCHVWMDGVLTQRSQGMWANFSDGSEIEIRSDDPEKMKEAYRKQDEYFLKGYPPRSSILTALDTLRLISACHKSMKGLRLVSTAERKYTR
jgi:predicted dehydrogenase